MQPIRRHILSQCFFNCMRYYSEFVVIRENFKWPMAITEWLSLSDKTSRFELTAMSSWDEFSMHANTNLTVLNIGSIL